MQNDANGEVLKSWLVIFSVWSWENIQHLEVQEVGFWNDWSERNTLKTYTESIMTVIISDEWRSAHTNSYFTVNHSRWFVDPITGVHTRQLERAWLTYKSIMWRLWGKSNWELQNGLSDLETGTIKDPLVIYSRIFGTCFPKKPRELTGFWCEHGRFKIAPVHASQILSLNMSHRAQEQYSLYRSFATGRRSHIVKCDVLWYTRHWVMSVLSIFCGKVELTNDLTI